MAQLEVAFESRVLFANKAPASCLSATKALYGPEPAALKGIGGPRFSG